MEGLFMRSRSKYGVAALFLIAVASTVTAQEQQVYRCTSPSGAVEYTQTPCTAGDQQKLVRTDAALSGTDPDAAKRQLDALIRDLIARREYDRAWSLAMTNEQRTAVTAARNADPIAIQQAASEARRAEADAANAAREAAEAQRNASEADGNRGVNYGVWYPSGYWNGTQGRRPPQQRPPYPHAPSRPASPTRPPPTVSPASPGARTLSPGATVRSGNTRYQSSGASTSGARKPLPAGDDPRPSAAGRQR
jgi:hypothetical protein